MSSPLAATGLKAIQSYLEAQVQARTTADAIDALPIVHNNGGDPVRDRSQMLIAQNEGMTIDEMSEITRSDGILNGLSARGLK